jgi:hypothetical protein
MLYSLVQFVIQTQCPIDFGAQKQEIEDKAAGMKKKYEDAMSAVLQL